MPENGNLQELLDEARAALNAENKTAQDIARRSDELQEQANGLSQEAAQSRLRRENLSGQVGALEAAMTGQAEQPDPAPDPGKPVVEVVDPAPPEQPQAPPAESVYVNPE